MPPNATLVTVTYNSRTRSEVELEWQVENEAGGGLTGFFLEHMWLSQRPGRRDKSNHSEEEPAAQKIGQPVWYRRVIQDPEVRGHTVGRLTPTENYLFRVTAVNHRTVGHPSAAKTPGTTSPESKSFIKGPLLCTVHLAARPSLFSCIKHAMSWM